MRLGLLVAGSAALVFATLVLVVSPQPVALERAAVRIVMGDRYKAEELDRFVGADELAFQPLVRAASLRSAAVVALRQAEESIANGQRTDIDRHMDALERGLRHALTIGPADTFLWLALFWRETFAGGFEPTRLSMLEMSYRTGPREGWVAVRRNAWTLGLYSRLGSDLQEAAAAEFIGLVASRFMETVSILTGPGWSVHDVLIPRLAMVDELQRKAFARALYQQGYDVQIPGIVRPDDRPWSR
jgi:hypothetical protein